MANQQAFQFWYKREGRDGGWGASATTPHLPRAPLRRLPETPPRTQTSGLVATLKLKWEQVPERGRHDIDASDSQSLRPGPGNMHKTSSIPASQSLQLLDGEHKNRGPTSIKLHDSKGTAKKVSTTANQLPLLAKATRLSPAPKSASGRSCCGCESDQVLSLSKAEEHTLSSPTANSSSITGSTRVGYHIDGPMNELPHLQKVSDVLKSIEIPNEINIVIAPAMSIEVTEFWEMIDLLRRKSNRITQLRLQYPTAPVLSQKLERSCSKNEDLLPIIVQIGESRSTMLHCTYKSKVGSVITKAVEKIHDTCKLSQGFIFKVCGREEYFENDKCLCDYEYVQQCRKFSTEVKVVLTKRTPSVYMHNMTQAAELDTSQEVISQKEINNLLGSFYTTEQRFRNIITAKDLVSSPCRSILVLAQSVTSCVKLVCEWLSFIEPPEVTEAVYEFKRACKTATQPEMETSSFFPTEDSHSSHFTSNDSWISVADENHVISKERVEDMLKALNGLKIAVHEALSLYCNSFYPGYAPKWSTKPECVVNSSEIENSLKIKICALHKVNEQELRRFESLQIEVSIFHGGRLISAKSHSPLAKVTRNFFCSVVWDKWLKLRVPIKFLPRESRALFVLHGVELPGSGTKQNKTIISWVTLNLFASNGILRSGSMLLGMWPGDDVDPLVSPSFDIKGRERLLQVSFENNERAIVFPKRNDRSNKKIYHAPSPAVFRTLLTIAQRDRFYCLSSEDRTLIWQTRLSCSSHLSNYPRGLPLVLQSTPYWHTDALVDIWSITKSWPLIEATFGLELLDPQFADMCVRAKAVEWLTELSDDDICDILPQLVQTLQYDCYPCSAMSKFLLTRAVDSPRISHFLYWNLKLLQTSDIKFRYCSSILLRALQSLVGTIRCMEFVNQAELIDQLRAIAYSVKAVRDAHRQTTLIHGLQRLSRKFVSKFQLPLDPALLVKGIEIKSCSFFNSNTVPLKISFVNADPFGEPIDIIYKVGDDLRQDILVLQMIKVMEKIWLRTGLDLKMVTYQCVATGVEEGMLEMVTEASTLRAIQTEHGLTGSFKDKPLNEWLMRHNPTDMLYKAAVDNFTLSCAGYCVATFVLGICDRHNDNIMVKKSGHMFHIDFGKILGNAQMFGNIKRDRAPFVLTRDMAYVINGSDHPTERFQNFTDICCTAYNAIRKYSDLIISLLSLMLSSGLPGLTSTDDILYVRDALLPGKSDLEATHIFTKYIAESLNSLATPLNFFIHNLAQFKLSSSSPLQAVLSLSSQTYSIATDGKILSAAITDAHKRFYPETHYVYQIKISRKSSKATIIFRRYREFHEMHTRLIQSFPENSLPLLPGKVLMRHKSLSKQTVEKRKAELNVYLKELIAMEPQISESDVIYTFLHYLTRDEEDLLKLNAGSKESQISAGKIQLEIQYSTSDQSLTIMVCRVRDLVPREGREYADPYVKLYLLPDHSKETKKKTKVVKKTLNPTYNETFTYTVPPSALNSQMLQLSLWDASNVWSNQCLCMTTVELSKIRSSLINSTSIMDWYALYNMQDN